MRDPRYTAVLALVAAAATLVLVAAGGQIATHAAANTRVSWNGLAGGARPHVAIGQRMIVVLQSPSLSDRVARAGGRVTERQERRWRSAALAAQNLLISRLSVQGVTIKAEFRYTRVLNGFSAPLDAQATALLERAPEVAGVYPVRVAYPAAVRSRLLNEAVFAPGIGHRPDLALPGFDGRGVTIALIDTGVDAAQPFLRGRVANGVDIVGGQAYALAAPKPDSPFELEEHGTELAGLLVGAGGPGGLAGVATGASVLPVRVAGWQRDASGGWSVYGRTDQLVAGLETAVDPNGDGDAHDAARIALVGVASPYAAFADDPVARAAAGALRLDTLVVAPAGNDGPAGPSFGSISGPGGAPSVVTVGAVDLRPEAQEVRVVARVGLDVVLDDKLPLGGVIAPNRVVTLGVSAPRGPLPGEQRRRSPGAPLPLEWFFDAQGISLVAGRAALVPAGDAPSATVANAARAGAAAVLVYGSRLPGGALGLDEEVHVPVIGISRSTARSLLDARRRRANAAVSIGAVQIVPNDEHGRVAAFSSSGLAYDGRVKPDLVAPGVALMTSEPGQAEDGSPRYGTVNGTSAAAAVTAGIAALLAQARPDLDGPALKSVLVGSARPLQEEPLWQQGAGSLDVGGAAAAELAADPASLALGNADASGWQATHVVRVRNVSTRAVRFRVRAVRRTEGAAALQVRVRPARVLLPQGRTVALRVTLKATSAPRGTAPAQGYVILDPAGGLLLRVPWAVTFERPRADLLRFVHLSLRSFEPSDAAPARLTLEVGRLPTAGGRQEVRPLDRLDIALLSSDGQRIGLLARLRDVLPGRYAFGITGRDPTGARLRRGDYALRVVAVPTEAGPATRRVVRFTIE